MRVIQPHKILLYFIHLHCRNENNDQVMGAGGHGGSIPEYDDIKPLPPRALSVEEGGSSDEEDDNDELHHIIKQRAKAIAFR